MKGKMIYRLIGAMFSAVLFLGLCSETFAAGSFSLTYSLTEGGAQMELTPEFASKGVTINATSDGTQYEIFQDITMPFRSNENPGQDLGDNFVVWALRGANMSKVRLPMDDPGTTVRSGERIYVSDTSGTDDNFTIIYSIRNTVSIQPGHYHGQVSFTLRPVRAQIAPIVKYLDIYATVSDRGLEIEIQPVNSLNRIALNPKKEDMVQADVAVKFRGIFNKTFSIVQSISTPLQSPEGNRIDLSTIGITTQDVKKGMGLQNATLINTQQTIYAPAPNGNIDESFLITYSVKDLGDTMAGKYRTKIDYFFVDDAGVRRRIATLDLEVENERVFDLIIKQESGLGRMEFNDLKPDEPPRVNELILEVRNNTGKQYQVSQNVFSDLTDKEGNTLPSSSFTMTIESLETKGTTKIAPKQEVKRGDTDLFASDSAGASDKFKIIYILTPSKEFKAGDYSTRITYSLLEL